MEYIEKRGVGCRGAVYFLKLGFTNHPTTQPFFAVEENPGFHGHGLTQATAATGTRTNIQYVLLLSSEQQSWGRILRL